MTATTAYILSSLLWSVGGLIVGFLVGKSVGRREALVIVETSGRREAVPVRSRTDTLLGVIVAVMAVVSVCVAAVSSARQNALVSCQTAFNEAFIAALTERSEAATEERGAQRALLEATRSGDPAQARAAIDTYLGRLTAADDKRNANPLPDRPDC